MKIAEIEPGTYRVHLTEEQSMIYKGCDVDARVIRAGFHYDVHYSEGTMIHGAPRQWTQRSEHPSGVEIEWDQQDVRSSRRGWKTEPLRPGRAVVNARAVKYAK